jgi:hypothetical protein
VASLGCRSPRWGHHGEALIVTSANMFLSSIILLQHGGVVLSPAMCRDQDCLYRSGHVSNINCF